MVSRSTTSAQRLRLCVVKCVPEVVYGRTVPSVQLVFGRAATYYHGRGCNVAITAIANAAVHTTARSGITGHVSPSTTAMVRTVSNNKQLMMITMHQQANTKSSHGSA